MRNKNPELLDRWGKTKTVGAASAGIATMIGISTVYLHRSETHGALKLKPAPRMAARAITWIGSGMKPREWATIHGKMHHPNEDRPGDPHSPVLNGRFGVLKVLFGNVPMYRKAAKEIRPEDVEPHLVPDKWDRRLFDRGLLGQAALFGIYTAVHKGNLKRATASWAMHDVAVIMAGGIINGLGHAGKGSMLRAMVNGPRPNDDGTYTRNLGKFMTVATGGEGTHHAHHEHPSHLRFNDNPWLDPGGVLAQFMIDVGIAEAGQAPQEEPILAQV